MAAASITRGRAMRSRALWTIGALVLAVSSIIVGSVVAGTRSVRDGSLRPTRHTADRGIERRVDQLLSKMTLDEKLQQVQLLSDGQITDEDARKGVGAVFSLVDPVKIRHLQEI